MVKSNAELEEPDDRKVVYLAMLVDPGDWTIRNMEIKDAIVMGPAVLLTTGNVRWRNVSFDMELDGGLLIECEQKYVGGTIVVEDVTFENCDFRNVALIGPKEWCERFKDETAKWQEWTE